MFRNSLRHWLVIMLMTMLSACTTVGVHDRATLDAIDFGPSEEMRICVLADQGIAEDEARRLLAAVADELSIFGVAVTVPWVRPWVRPAFMMQGIYEEVALLSLEAPCDRQVALVGRHLGDFLFALIGPEMLGAVDEATHTRGFVVARKASLNQLFLSPADVAVHESYHLLGCGHGLSLAECYPQIRDLKRTTRRNREQGNEFFPGVSLEGKPIVSRQESDRLISYAVNAARSRSQDAGELNALWSR